MFVHDFSMLKPAKKAPFAFRKRKCHSKEKNYNFKEIQLCDQPPSWQSCCASTWKCYHHRVSAHEV